MQLRKWYFAINDAGLIHYERMIKVAIKSARKNTRLKPICLYYGTGRPFIEALKADGVEVINRTPTLIDAINSTENANGWHKNIASGAMLRLDIPLIERRDKYVLYTDCDVIFLKHPELRPLPEFFASAPEHDRNSWSFVNTGAMIINVENMRLEHAALCDFARPRLNTFGPLGHGTYDQGILNAYYEGRWTRLPLEMNWKPYWGWNDNASIIHFHGPKPDSIEAILGGKDDTQSAIYRNIFAMNPDSMRLYLDTFKAIEAEPSVPPGWLRRLLPNFA